LAIGVAGVLALLFASLVVYRSVRNEGLVPAPVPIEEDVEQQKQAFFPDSQPAGSTTQPAKPEKRAPLDEH
jgi:hypothetical protein